MSEPVRIQLDYSNPNDREPPPPLRGQFLFRLILWCWATPLALGLLILAAFAATRYPLWIILAYCVIWLGTLMALVGTALAIVLAARRWNASKQKFKEVVLPTLLLIGLLGSNFVAASACLIAGVSIAERGVHSSMRD